MSENNSKYPEERCKTCENKEHGLAKIMGRYEPIYHPCTCCQCIHHEVDHYQNKGDN